MTSTVVFPLLAVALLTGTPIAIAIMIPALMKARYVADYAKIDVPVKETMANFK